MAQPRQRSLRVSTARKPRRWYSQGLSLSAVLPGVAGPFDPQEELVMEVVTDVDAAKGRIKDLLNSSWASEAGIMLFVLSVMSMRDPARTGQFGHCGQEMLNLILTGQACSQVHDGVVELADTGLHLRGVSTRPRVGLLARLEALRYCQVDRHCDDKSFEQQVFELGKRAFASRDIQENGSVETAEMHCIKDTP